MGFRVRLAVGRGHRCLAAVTAMMLLGTAVTTAVAQEAEKAEPPRPAAPTGRLITIKGTIDTAVKHRVMADVRSAAQQGIETLLFDFQPAASDFAACYGLANDLARAGGGIRRKVAYISAPITGHAVLCVLACDEIVVGDQGRLGEVFRDRNEEGNLTEITAYQDIARQKGHNTLLARGFIDRSVQLLLVSTPNGNRVIDEADLEKLKNEGLRVTRSSVIKQKGEGLVLDAAAAKRYSLATLAVASRAELAAAYGLPEKTVEERAIADAIRPVILRLDGAVNARLHQYVLRRLRQAQADGINFLIVEIDSTHGDESSAVNIAEAIRGYPNARKVAWVPKNASGAATLLLFGCDELVIAPKAVIGPLASRDTEPKEAKRKADDAVNLAAASRFPNALVRAFVDPHTIVYEVRGKTNPGLRSFKTAQELDEPENARIWEKAKPGPIKEAGRYLQVSGDEAVSLDLAVGVAESRDDLARRYDIDTVPAVLQPSWVDTLVDALRSTGATVFLIVVGMACLYIEVQIPGFGVAGLLSLLCFALFFWARWLGDLVNSLEIMLFVLGMLLLAVELFVIPGFGITGIAGIGLIVSSLLLASQSFVIPRTEAESRELVGNIVTVSGSLFVSVFAIVGLAQFFPKLPIFNRMMLSPPDPTAVADPLETVADPDLWSMPDLLGKIGVAVTPLRPAGRMEHGGQFYDVIAQGEFVDPGTPVEVLEVRHNRIYVRQTHVRG